MLLLSGIKNTRDHYARKKFYIIQPVSRADSDLSSYDIIEWPEGQKCMRLTIRSGQTENVAIDTALSQQISLERLTSGRNRWKSNGGNGGCEKYSCLLSYRWSIPKEDKEVQAMICILELLQRLCPVERCTDSNTEKECSKEYKIRPHYRDR